MKVKITDIRFYSTNKDGQPLLDKNGRPFDKATIRTQQHGTKWLSGFAYQDSPIKHWKIGDEAEIEIKENGQWLNFSLPKKTPQGGMSDGVVVSLLGSILNELKLINGKLSPSSIETVEEVIAPDDMPDF